jgi:GTPase involved in cell partitioning and DNA repair
MIYCEQFRYKPQIKTLADFPDYSEEVLIKNALVAFTQMEAADEENMKYVETKLVKNLKWAAKKNEVKHIILHSFAHLSESKASPQITKQLFDLVETRLNNADYKCEQTPFGYFLDIDVKAPGRSSARIFKSF